MVFTYRDVDEIETSMIFAFRDADEIETWMLEKLQLAQEENYKVPMYALLPLSSVSDQQRQLFIADPPDAGPVFASMRPPNTDFGSVFTKSSYTGIEKSNFSYKLYKIGR